MEYLECLETRIFSPQNGDASRTTPFPFFAATQRAFLNSKRFRAPKMTKLKNKMEKMHNQRERRNVNVEKNY